MIKRCYNLVRGDHMRKKTIAFTLIGLLGILGLLSVFFGLFVLPQLSYQMGLEFPELLNIQLPMLILVEILIILFIVGIIIVVYLLNMYVKDNIYNFKFTNFLAILVGMCIIAAISLIGIFMWLSAYGGPGPGLALMLIAGSLVVLIVSIVIYLIRVIVLEAIELKNEIDLVV